MRLLAALAILATLAVLAPTATAEVVVAHDDWWGPLPRTGSTSDGGYAVWVPAGLEPEDGSIYACVCP